MKTPHIALLVLLAIVAILRLYAWAILHFAYRGAAEEHSDSAFLVVGSPRMGPIPGGLPDVSAESYADGQRREPNGGHRLSGRGDGVPRIQSVVCPRCGSVVELEDGVAR